MIEDKRRYVLLKTVRTSRYKTHSYARAPVDSIHGIDPLEGFEKIKYCYLQFWVALAVPTSAV
jgi:hypothetical protein